MSDEAPRILKNLNLITTVSAWKAVSAALWNINNEVTLQIVPEGLLFNGMDPGHHLKIEMLWPRENFQTFESEGLDKISFNTDELNKVLKRLDNSSNVIVIWKKSVLHFQTADKEFAIRLIEPYFSEVPKVNINLTVNFKIATSKMKSILDDMKVADDHVRIESQNGKVIFSSKEDMGSRTAKVIYEPDEELEDQKVTFSAMFMTILNDLQPYCDEVQIFFGDHKPLKLVFDVPSVGIINYFVAPVTDP